MGKDVKVLVLDDEQVVCERLKDFLESKKFSVETFTDSQKAMDRIKEEPFDVVITDLKMAGYTGMDVLHFIRDERPTTQVILITAYGQIETFHEASMLGALEVVNKPFKMEDIHKLVKKAAKRKRRHG